MIDFLNWTVLLLVMVRISAFVALAPFFTIGKVPVLVKAGFAFVLTLTVVPFVAAPQEVISAGTGQYLLLVVEETFNGLLLGFIADLIFQAVRVGGEMVDLQMGFAMASVLDPQSGARVTLMGQFQYFFAMLIFFTLNGHHSLIMALVKSFEMIPLAGGVFSGAVVQEIVHTFVTMFAVAFSIAAPIIAVLVISDLSLGLVSRTVPQLNVFILGFPLKAGLGMLVVALTLPLLAAVVTDLVSQMEKDLVTIMGSLM